MDIRLPNLGEGTESATVTAILVSVGDRVDKEDALVELESEKAIASLPSTAAGTITHIHVREGDEIRVGAPIVSLAAAGQPVPSPEKRPAPKEGGPESGRTSPRTTGDDATTNATPVAAPSIRKLARNLGIELGRLRPTGSGGRIVLRDLRDYISRLQSLDTPSSASSKPAATAIDFSRWGPIAEHKASPLRKTIARRMVESWSTIPHVTQFLDADITRLMALRKEQVPAYKERGARLTLTPIVLKAVALTLPRHPMLNSSLDETSESIVTKAYYHIGIAVDTEDGLLVPVIRDVDQKSILELAREIEELSQRARRRETSRDEMQGGTFTVSNQGGIGGAHFTPIINKPEVAILGMGRGREGLKLRDGTAEPRTLLPLTLSHDHRVVDGADGVRFLVDLADTLEDFPEAELKLE